MTVRTLCALLVALSVLTLTSPASAHPTSYPGERMANNPTVNELIKLSEDYWTARKVTPWVTIDPDTRQIVPCAEHVVRFADNLDDFPDEHAVGKARRPGCEVWILVSYISWIQDHPTDKAAAWLACVDVLHEVGHTGGLEHSTDPRSPMYWTMTNEVPWDCRVWARARAATATVRRARMVAAKRLAKSDPAPKRAPK